MCVQGDPLKLFYIVNDNKKQKLRLPKPEALPLCAAETPRYPSASKKRPRKRKHSALGGAADGAAVAPVVVPSTSVAIADALGRAREDVGPEFTPAETATSGSLTTDSDSTSSSESEADSDSEDNDASQDAPQVEPTPADAKAPENSTATPDVIKRPSFETVRSQLMSGQNPAHKGALINGGGSPGSTPLSTREYKHAKPHPPPRFITKRPSIPSPFVRKNPVEKKEKADFATDPMDSMDGPGKIIYPSKFPSNKNKVVSHNGTDKEISRLNKVKENGSLSKKKRMKKSVPKSPVGFNSNSHNVVSNSKTDMRTHSKEQSYKTTLPSKNGSKDGTHKLHRKDNGLIPLTNGKYSFGAVRHKDSSQKVKSKDGSSKSPKEYVSKSVSPKDPTPPKGLSSKEASPGDDDDDMPRPSLTLKIKYDTEKGAAGERKSSMSPRSYVVLPGSSSFTPEASGGGTKRSTPGSGGESGSHKRSRSSSSDGSRSNKERRSGSLGCEEGVTHYVTKLSPGTETGKSPTSQREPIKMTIAKSQISPPLKINISPPLKIPISPPPPNLKSQLSPPLKMTIYKEEDSKDPRPSQNEVKSGQRPRHLSGSERAKVTKDKSNDISSRKTDSGAKNGTSDNMEVVKCDTKDTETTTNHTPQVSPNSDKGQQGKQNKKVDKRKSLEDKVSQLHKAKQNEQLQLLNRSGPGGLVTAVSEDTVTTTDPYHFSDNESNTPTAQLVISTKDMGKAVKPEPVTIVKFKKNMGTSPGEESGVAKTLKAQQPKVACGQFLPQNIAIPNSFSQSLSRVLAQGVSPNQQTPQKPDSTTDDQTNRLPAEHLLKPEHSILLQQLQASPLLLQAKIPGNPLQNNPLLSQQHQQQVLLEQSRIAQALQQAQQQQQQQQQKALQQQMPHTIQQLQKPVNVRTQQNKARPPLSPLRAMHKLPTMAPTSPGVELGKPQAKRPRYNSGVKQQLQQIVSTAPSPAGPQPAANKPLVNGQTSDPGRPASVPPQFPPGPFVNGIAGPVAMQTPGTLSVRPGGNLVRPTVVNPPAPANAGNKPVPNRPPPQRPALQPNTNGLQSNRFLKNNRFLSAYQDWYRSQDSAVPPPHGNSPPAHMHSYPPVSAGLAPAPAHSNTTTPITDGYDPPMDAPLELTTKKRDTSTSDSKNNNTAPNENTILKVPNLLSLKT